MFINDVNKKEEVKRIAIETLRKNGIKYRPKKPSRNVQGTSYGKKFFKVPLESIQNNITVTLKDGLQLKVPRFLHEMCVYVLKYVETEGLFRKEAAKNRQTEIKLALDRGVSVSEDSSAIEVAACIKCFLRELPEPLIPFSYQELFVRCSITEDKLGNVLLACLLLPTEHLNVLSYLVQFFTEVASSYAKNKMTSTNLAVCIAPNVFPMDPKALTPTQAQLMNEKTVLIMQMLIDNASSVGVIPEFIIDRMVNSGSIGDGDGRKKKRRSGSLTRMFHGFKKMVGPKGEEPNLVVPDLLLTPSINRSVKKRKAAEAGMSALRKREVVNKLPDSAILNTPFTPRRTPICSNPNAKDKLIASQQSLNSLDTFEIQKEKKSQWYQRSKSVKSLKEEDEFKERRNSLGPRAMLERRWSQVSQAANFRKKKRNSCAGALMKKPEIRKGAKETQIAEDTNSNEVLTEPDYVRIPKTEYEEIKERVSAMERRISMEFDNVQLQKQIEENENNLNVEDKIHTIDNVQTAYEQTLDHMQPLSPTTDHLARRLSRDLRIRRNSDNKIMRSPSARKIGSLRRRSREMERKNNKVTRNLSWHVNTSGVQVTDSLILQNSPKITKKEPEPITPPQIQRMVTRSSSFNNFKTPTPVKQSNRSNASKTSTNTSGSSNVQWVSAENFFSTFKTPSSMSSANSRASIAKIRSQNAGMVLAKAKLFDNLQDSDQSSQNSDVKTVPKVKNVSTGKIGSARNNESRLSYRVKTLRQEERRIGKKSLSPRRRAANLNHKQRLHMAKQYVALKNKENDLGSPTRKSDHVYTNVSSPRTPRNVPHIKKNLNVRSPKRLCRTPVGIDRKTPLKVLVAPKCEL